MAYLTPLHARPIERARHRAVLLFALGLVSLCGCSVTSGFHRDWNSPCCCNTRPDELAGCWEGCWKSNCTSHHGKLQAIISQIDETHYSARFHGTFFKIVPFQYRLVLSARREGDRWVLSGRKELGQLVGGTYQYEGYATDCDFVCRYSCCKDNGVFIMTRRGCGTCCR
ncbi:MAG TPA: hypothetical protein VND64_16840 [Pirellulales bacterium]|nr:hypothetical protein [Pirellulales bacterium]